MSSEQSRVWRGSRNAKVGGLWLPTAGIHVSVAVTNRQGLFGLWTRHGSIFAPMKNSSTAYVILAARPTLWAAATGAAATAESAHSTVRTPNEVERLDQIVWYIIIGVIVLSAIWAFTLFAVVIVGARADRRFEEYQNHDDPTDPRGGGN